ncbi:4Fe-4S dicluster domain-containing protein [Lutispora saccharofermentans]|uniref:4Fe-4S binding protein n=1 Tax=Lutispora saccharofermentans TaxID=3024236 RepID=A0ABT1NDR8_9FIRM|nr:4Fe-4S binding protein [Lutispora saccharofermentans]
MLTVRVDESKCTGCGLCKAVCSVSHGLHSDKKRISDLPKALLFIEPEAEGSSISICRHCENPVCVNACVAQALKVDIGKGAVIVNKDKCVGCWSCIMECPFGALRIHDTAFKCDGCGDWDKPMCASFCPTGALTAQRSPIGMTSSRRREKTIISGYKGVK